jgi:hypothetical protein
MNPPDTSLLFNPDISGFTDFVNQTEISHNRHFISKLLEIIIDSDNLNMQIVEGDAVFFFKEKAPSVSALIKQCQNSFLNFHNHLNRDDTKSFCRCEACETVADLSLKFIIHQGRVEKINIKNHHKLKDMLWNARHLFCLSFLIKTSCITVP